MNNRCSNGERGEVMLEGLFVVIVTLIVMVWLLALCFFYYQKYTVRIATNDAATKIAYTYNNPSSDIVMGFIDTTDIKNRNIYFPAGNDAVNQTRAQSYVNYMLDKANFNGVVEDVVVTVERTGDFMGRSHVKVTTQCTLNTPFGFAMDFFGMDGQSQYTVTSYADSTDLSTYISSVAVVDAFTDGRFLSGTGFIDKVFKLANKIIGFD